MNLRRQCPRYCNNTTTKKRRSIKLMMKIVTKTSKHTLYDSWVIWFFKISILMERTWLFSSVDIKSSAADIWERSIRLKLLLHVHCPRKMAESTNTQWRNHKLNFFHSDKSLISGKYGRRLLQIKCEINFSYISTLSAVTKISRRLWNSTWKRHCYLLI